MSKDALSLRLLAWAWVSVLAALLTHPSGAVADPPQCPPTTGAGGQNSDIIFLIDGSGSISTTFAQQQEGIHDSVCGPDAFVPVDGSVAVAIVEFSNQGQAEVEIPLTVVNPATRDLLCECIVTSLEPQSGYTYMASGLQEVRTLFEASSAPYRYLLISSDGFASDVETSKQLAQALRTMVPPVSICSIMVGQECLAATQEEVNFLKDLANVDGQYPNEPIGGYGCADQSGEYVDHVNDCLCSILNSTSPDCDSDGVPDPCERDCNENGTPDDCEPDTTDVNCDGVRDDCQGLRFVDFNAPGPNHDGLSWDTAFLTLQDALAAVQGAGRSLIYVADGVYTPAPPGSGAREATFQLYQEVSIYGGFAGAGAPDPSYRDPAVHVTVLSGDLNGDDDLGMRDDNVYHVVTASGIAQPLNVNLDGVVIAGGNANGVCSDCAYGGGMIAPQSRPLLSNCRFMANTAAIQGGGCYVTGDAVLVGCAFSGNAAVEGGAFRAQGAAPKLINCTIVGNAATGLCGGAMLYYGTMTNSIVWGNTAPGGGESAQISAYRLAPISYSIVQDWSGALGGTNNSFATPLFVDADGADNIFGTLDDDLRPVTGSPAIDAGENAAFRSDICTDLAGGARFLDDPAAADRGRGVPPLIDLGAYEFNITGGDCNGNGVPDAQESPDCDANGIPDQCEADTDLDQLPDACDPDDDNDGFADAADNCPKTYNPDQRDCDGDGIGDVCDASSGLKYDYDHDCDIDMDDLGIVQLCYDSLSSVTQACIDKDVAGENRIVDDADMALMFQCLSGPTISALDTDHDGVPDSCDGDDDNDGVPDEVDRCPLLADPGQPDADSDNIGDLCDNCPVHANPDQEDLDEDGVGDACDNCWWVWNPDQQDTDGDGIGDECEYVDP